MNNENHRQCHHDQQSLTGTVNPKPTSLFWEGLKLWLKYSLPWLSIIKIFMEISDIHSRLLSPNQRKLNATNQHQRHHHHHHQDQLRKVEEISVGKQLSEIQCKSSCHLFARIYNKLEVIIINIIIIIINIIIIIIINIIIIIIARPWPAFGRQGLVEKCLEMGGT